MKSIVFSKPFRASYRERIAPYPPLIKLFHQKLKLFVQDPRNPELYDHALKENLVGYRAFSLNYDLRVVYQENPKSIILINVGTHPQVYQ